jgi:Family of unknown function (DUF6314)
MIAIGKLDFFGMLLGRWNFAREIAGHGSMKGTAVFELASEGRAEYFEFGELALKTGERLRAERRYVYEALDGGFKVRFHETGEIFERAVFVEQERGGWKASANHLCDKDLYESEYCFPMDGTFTVRHEVRGPKKDYLIRTIYRRD